MNTTTNCTIISRDGGRTTFASVGLALRWLTGGSKEVANVGQIIVGEC